MLVEAVRHHHHPSKAENFQQACQVIFIANEVTQAETLDNEFYERINTGKDASQLGLDIGNLTEALDHANSQFSEMSAMFSL
jgi:hypothetical protein